MDFHLWIGFAQDGVNDGVGSLAGWDGGFALSKILGKKDVINYNGLDSMTPPLLTYAAPLQRLVVTGKGLNDKLLSKAEVLQAEFAASEWTEKELLEDFSCWSPKVKMDSGLEITKRDLDNKKLLFMLVPIAKDPKNQGRIAALWALGRINEMESAKALAECLEFHPK